MVLKKQSGDVKDGMSQKETVKLGEIAQVVPRGRMVHVMVAEKDVRVFCSPIWLAIRSTND